VPEGVVCRDDVRERDAVGQAQRAAALEPDVGIPLAHDDHGVANREFLRVCAKDCDGTFLPTGPVMVAAQLPDSNPVKKPAVAFVKAYEAKFGAGNVAAGSTLTGAQVAAQINLYTGTTGVTASVNTSGDVTLSNTDGSAISVSQTITLGTGASGTGLSAAVAGSVATPKVTQGKVTLIDSKPVTITDVGTAGGSAALGFTSGQATTLSTTSTGATATLANQDVLTVADANSTIASVDSALATVSAFQAQLGAIQDRFTSAVSNLTSTAQNLTQSRSTIQDADFAAETANLTQAQVLEQAGISVLAQANQQPQLILKLLS